MFDDVTVDRFWSKVDKSAGPDSCWPWLGYIREDGYGVTRVAGRRYRAHRAAYNLTNGEMNAELVTDHLCRNRSCCNPRHLEAVTNKENLMRGVGYTATNSQKTHCKHGHEFTSENIYLYRGWRHCKTCRVERVMRTRGEAS